MRLVKVSGMPSPGGGVWDDGSVDTANLMEMFRKRICNVWLIRLKSGFQTYLEEFPPFSGILEDVSPLSGIA